MDSVDLSISTRTGIAAFDRDARRVDAVAAHEVVADRFGTAAIEIVIRTGVLFVVVVADDEGVDVFGERFGVVRAVAAGDHDRM